ncbi:MAG: SH3 domain-containing protein [Caldilinea sp.]|nr:SH3 domain-containing protein [Caldilinea sp.]
MMKRFVAMGFGRRAMGAGGLLVAAMMVAGCGLFGGAETAPTAVPTRTPLPTFTPTAAVAVQEAAAPTTAPVEAAAPAAAQPVATDAPAAPEQPAAEPTATPTPTPAAKPVLAITADAVNVRAAPSTDAELVGLATIGQQFDVTARTAAGDWWQVCCVNGQAGWVYGELATVTGGEAAPIVADAAPVEPAPVAEAPTEAPVEAAPVAEAPATEAPAAEAPGTPPDPSASSAGWFDPNAQYQITNFRVLGLGENNGGIRDTSAQHLIFLTVLDQNGNGVDGAVVRNLVGEKGEVTTGAKGPGKAEITMYYEPFKLAVVSDGSGPVTSQVSNQMGLIFPHLPDIVGKLGDASYEYGACPTLEDRCQWPLSDVNYVHFSYEITFQKVK